MVIIWIFTVLRIIQLMESASVISTVAVVRCVKVVIVLTITRVMCSVSVISTATIFRFVKVY